MKTATITLHLAHNNGSFLQAFALQETLSLLNVENDLIDYLPKAQYSLYQNIIFKEASLKGLIKGVLNVPHYKSLNLRKKRFNDIQQVLKKTDRFENEIEFEEIVEPYDCLIAGSDQIWNNATMPDFSYLYLLPVSNKYKISYAPSFGKSLEGQFEDSNILENIKNIDRLSVRESSVRDYLNDCFPEKEVKLVLDPTFLLEKKHYEVLEKNSNCKYTGDFIFFYCIKASNDVLKLVKRISETLNLPVVTIFTGVNTYKCQMFGQKVDFSAGPAEFVEYVKNAKYVISNSFHGIVFSIIYNKNFFRSADIFHGELKKDERLDSILEILGLTAQNVTNSERLNLNKEIDFKDANKKLDELRSDSIIWLKESIKIDNKF